MKTFSFVSGSDFLPTRKNTQSEDIKTYEIISGQLSPKTIIQADIGAC